MRTSGFTSHGPERQWVEILSCEPSTKTIQGILGDGGHISISVHDVPVAFRWPKIGEWWSVNRDPISQSLWTLGQRIHGRTSETQNGSTAISLNEKAPIENMSPGQVRIDAEVITNALGHILASSSTGSVFIQTEAPDALPPYVWVQIGTPSGGWTVWFEDGS